MGQLPEEIEAAITDYAGAVFKRGRGDNAADVAGAEDRLCHAIFAELVSQREIGREESIADEMGAGREPDDPVGLFIKEKLAEENQLDPDWVNPFVVGSEFAKYMAGFEDTKTPFLKRMKGKS